MIYPSLNYDFRLYQADANGKPAGASFTRATAGYRINAIGLLESVSAGNLRHDYDPVTGEYLGILIEENRTNLALYSKDIAAAGWQAYNGHGTLTANNIISPDGTQNALKFQGDGHASGSYLIQSIPIANGTAYTMSAYLRAGDDNTITMRDALNGQAAATFTLAGSGSVALGMGSSASIKPLGNGWYRCSLTFTSSFTHIWVALTAADGLATSAYFYVWGVQLEAGFFPTSFIATLSTSATRQADVLSIATNAFPFNPGEGTLLVNATVDHTSTDSEFAAQLNDGDNSDYIGFSNLAMPQGMVRAAGGSIVSLNAAGSLAHNFRSMALGYKTNDCAMAVNGVLGGTSMSVALPTGITTLSIGMHATAAQICGWVRHIAYFPRRLSNVELQSISA